MDDPVAEICKEHARCMADKCNKEGCKLPLNNLSTPFVLIDMDNESAPIEKNAKRCDYLFIGRVKDKETIWVAPLELKKGSPKASEVVPQLQAGARTAEKLLQKDDQNGGFKFCPIAACGRGLHKSQWNEIRHARNKIKFRQQTESVRLIKCGTPLVSAFAF